MTARVLLCCCVATAGCLAGCSGPDDSYRRLKLGEPVPAEVAARHVVGEGQHKLSGWWPIPMVDNDEWCVAYCDDGGRVALKRYSKRAFYVDPLILRGSTIAETEVLVPPDWRQLCGDVSSVIGAYRKARGLPDSTQKDEQGARSLEELVNDRLSRLDSRLRAQSRPSSMPQGKSMVMFILLVESLPHCDMPEEFYDPKLLSGLQTEGFHKVLWQSMFQNIEASNLGQGRIRVKSTYNTVIPFGFFVGYFAWLFSGAHAG